MTLREIMAAAAVLPESALDLEVFAQGCDCIRKVKAVKIEQGKEVEKQFVQIVGEEQEIPEKTLLILT